MAQPKYSECKVFYVDERDFKIEFIDKIRRCIDNLDGDRMFILRYPTRFKKLKCWKSMHKTSRSKILPKYMIVIPGLLFLNGLSFN
jgi:hypothetical protein